MNLSNKVELIQTQKLIMTNQLQQSLSILNMSNLELEEEVKKEAEENPLLEVESKSEIDWEEYIKSIDNKRHDSTNYNLDNEITLENMVKYESNLYDYIKLQLGLFNLRKKERDICEYLVDCLDKDGYLAVDEKYILKELNISKEEYKKCLENIQQLEPSGIGARNLSECLLIQMDNHGIHDPILKKIIEEDLELIGKNKYRQISKKHNITLEECVKYIDKIKGFDPKPGRLCSNENPFYIQPDVIVRKIDGEFCVFMNESGSFTLSINNYYKDVLKNPTYDEGAKQFIKNKLNYAAGLIKNIESRKSTILQIAEEIVKEQRDFFEKGSNFIKPMKLKDIAYTLGYHESTISRGINCKYMLTPFGLYDFKYFFSSSISGESDEEISSIKIKKLIKEMIDNENKLKPLSDDDICKSLKEDGINVARRTVAKYRESMNIPSSSKRKQFCVRR